MLQPWPGIAVRRLTDLAARRQAERAIEEIFFEASGRAFEAEAERRAFHECWLGRYLAHWPHLAFVLIGPPPDSPTGGDRIGGYLVGSIENPAASPLFSDLGYFQDFRGLCARFPAHCHINLAPPFRARGLGGLLIEAFAAEARAAGASGLHVVTGRDARNVSFYTRLGFKEAGATLWNGREIVLLGCALT